MSKLQLPAWRCASCTPTSPPSPPTSSSRNRPQWRHSRISCGRRRARPWAACGSSSATRPTPGSRPTSTATLRTPYDGSVPAAHHRP